MMHTISKFKHVLLVPLIALAFFTVQTSRAEAQVPSVFVPVFDSANTAVNSSNFSWDMMGQHTLSTLAYTAGQIALDQITNNTVNWIKGGFNGSPSFAIDSKKLFNDLADITAGELASEVRNLASCNFTPTFNNDLANSLELSTRSNAPEKFAAQVRCPFPSTINASSFYNDFRNGGWDGFTASLSDSGNVFGVAIRANQELVTRQAETEDIKKQELGWASGFLSVPDTANCTYPEGVGQPGSWTEGLSQGQIDQAYCPKSTPGKVVSDQLSGALGTDVSRLGFADNLDKIIGTLIGQLTRQAMSGIFQ